MRVVAQSSTTLTTIISFQEKRSKKGLTWQMAYIGGGFLGVFFCCGSYSAA